MIFHTFITEGIPEELVLDHQKVCQAKGVAVQYHVHPASTDYNEIYTAHGQMMNGVMESLDNVEVGCFLDIDCLPYDVEVLSKAYTCAKEQFTFVGNAQNISHTHMRNRLYAAASTLFISKECWNKLSKPRLDWFMLNETQIDTAQALTLVADDVGYPYQLMYPIGCDKKSWPLGNYGMYGKGTLYPGSYHYFQLGRPSTKPLPELWKKRVEDILEGREIISKFQSKHW